MMPEDWERILDDDARGDRSLGVYAANAHDLIAEVERLRAMYRMEMGSILDLAYQGRTVRIRMTGSHGVDYVVGVDNDEFTFGEWAEAAEWLRLMADRP